MARARLRPARSSVIPRANSSMSSYQTQDGSGRILISYGSRSSGSTFVCPSMPVSADQYTISPVCEQITSLH